MNGVRCHQRLLRAQEEKGKDDRLLNNQAADWKARVLPLVCGRPGERQYGARQAARQRIVQQETFVEEAEIEDDLLLTKPRFTAYMRFWEGYGTDSASESFERRAEISEHEDDRGWPAVRVKDNPRVRAARGRRASTRAGGDQRDPERGHRGDPRDPGREHRPRHRDRGASGATVAADAAGGRAAAPRRGDRSPSAATRASGRSARGSGTLQLGAAASSRGGPRADAERRGQRQGAASPEAAAADGAKRNSAVEFMKHKTGVKKKLADNIGTYSGKKATAEVLRAMLEKLNQEQKKELKHNGDAEAILQSLDTLVANLKQLQDEVNAASKVALAEIEGNCDAAVASLQAKEAEAKDFVEAAEFLVGQAATDSRKRKQASRYQRVKLAERLVAGGFGKRSAKLASEQWQELTGTGEAPMNPGTPDYVKPMIFTAEAGDGDGPGSGRCVLAGIEKFQAEAGAKIHDKAETLRAACVEHGWKGALARIPQAATPGSPTDWSPGLAGDCVHADHPGACGWLAAFAPYAWRFGPAAWPLPGVGSWVRLHAGDVGVQLLPVQPLVECGVVALNDIAKFLETDSGIQLLSDSCVWVRLTKGQVLWIPYGYVAIPTLLSGDAGDEQDEFPLAQVWSLAVFHEGLCKKVSDKAWGAVRSFNEAHRQKMGTAAVWAGRKELFEKFCKDLAR